ncbi:MAG: SPOR domain-containing protein [Desulfuromonadales bacterium]
MSDKDQFTFDENDEFPETDLSESFADAEHVMEDPPAEEADDSASSQTDWDNEPSQPSQTGIRFPLLLLLLVIGGFGGVYYVLNLGETPSDVPTVPAQTQKPAPAETTLPSPAGPAAESAAETAQKGGGITVPAPAPPSAQPGAGQEAAATGDSVSPKPAVVDQQADAAAPQGEDQAVAETSPPESSTRPPAVSEETTAAAGEAPSDASQPDEAGPAMAKPDMAAATTPTEASPQAGEGLYILNAGAYLLDANRDALVAKIRKLGYEPVVTSVDTQVDMTRLRLGTFASDEVDEALAAARAIEPGAYSAPAGEGYVIYAGTFLTPGNIKRLTQKFLEQGIKVYPEPVRVTKKLSRVRFGSFATRDEAVAAADALAEAGVETVVIKSR